MRCRGSFQIARECSIVALIISIMFACIFTLPINAPLFDPGDLIWKKTNNPSSGTDKARGVAVDGTGVYIVGWDEKPGLLNERWRIEKRSLKDGSLIWKKTSNPSSGRDLAFKVAVDGTGIYIVGYDRKTGDARWRIEKRSLADGSLLWKKTSNPSSGHDEAYGVAVDGTGIYIVGCDEHGGDRRWRIEKRSLTTGSKIWTRVGDPSSGDDVAWGVAVDASGVYIVGYDERGGDRRWRMEMRELADGSLLWKKTSNPTSSRDEAYGVAVDGTDVYIVGYDNRPGNWRWRIEKRNIKDGSLLWKKFSNPSSDLDAPYGVAVDGTGVYIVGQDQKFGIFDERWRMEKRDPTTGNLIWKKTSNPSGGNEAALDVVVDDDGVYIVGDSHGGTRWRIEKRHP